jgi:preprotein translocase subunit YajC
MEIIKYIIGIQVLLWSIAIMVIIYLVIIRIKKSKEEKFEKRNN